MLRLLMPHLSPTAKILDLGAGEGYFSMLVGNVLREQWGIAPAEVLSACDVTPEIFRYDEIPCTRIETDGHLPYGNGTFDAVCSLEVVEHVEDQFAFCREIARVLRPGGTAFISTPNILNLNSRYRSLHSGFATLFNPLPLTGADVVHTSGHIHPVSYYYLAFALYRAGMRAVSVDYDRFKRSALAILAWSWPFVLLGHIGFLLKLRRRNPALVSENAALLRDTASLRMLTSRSIIVRAVLDNSP